MGSALSQTGGHGDYRHSDSGVCFHGGHTVAVVDGADALRVAAREQLRSGAHAIKIFTSGGVVSPTDPIRVPQYSAEEIRAVVDEARMLSDNSHLESRQHVRKVLASLQNKVF